MADRKAKNIMGLASIDNHPVKLSGKLYLYVIAPITTKQKIKVFKFKVTHLIFYYMNIIF